MNAVKLLNCEFVTHFQHFPHFHKTNAVLIDFPHYQNERLQSNVKFNTRSPKTSQMTGNGITRVLEQKESQKNNIKNEIK